MYQLDLYCVRRCVCGAYQLSFILSFFFQAEDGIRDLVRSRGLGDVYKRQGQAAALDGVIGPINLVHVLQAARQGISVLQQCPPALELAGAEAETKGQGDQHPRCDGAFTVLSGLYQGHVDGETADDDDAGAPPKDLRQPEIHPILGAAFAHHIGCLLYTSDAADERSSVDLGGRRIIKKKNTIQHS